MDNLEKLSPIEKWEVLTKYLGIRVTSGSRYFTTDEDGGTKRFLMFAKKKDKKTVQKAINHAIDNKKRTVKKPFNESVVDKYISEATSENTVARMIQKNFGVKIKKVDVKRRIVFQLAKPIDENDFDSFDKIDGIHDLLKKAYRNSTTEHDYDRFIVEEL